ncbi:hypothetical protein Q7P35_012608 [Cladosporium inversicolor]
MASSDSKVTYYKVCQFPPLPTTPTTDSERIFIGCAERRNGPIQQVRHQRGRQDLLGSQSQTQRGQSRFGWDLVKEFKLEDAAHDIDIFPTHYLDALRRLYTFLKDKQGADAESAARTVGRGEEGTSEDSEATFRFLKDALVTKGADEK